MNNFKRNVIWLPWWSSGWEFTCQCRGHSFNPWSGKIPHALAQLSLCATTTKDHAPRGPSSSTREATAKRNTHAAVKSSPHLPQLEKACLQQWRPSIAKKRYFFLNVKKKKKCDSISWCISYSFHIIPHPPATDQRLPMEPETLP